MILEGRVREYFSQAEFVLLENFQWLLVDLAQGPSS